ARREAGEDAGHRQDPQHVGIAVHQGQREQPQHPDQHSGARRQDEDLVAQLGPRAAHEVPQRSSSKATPKRPSGRTSSTPTMMASATAPLRYAPAGSANTVIAST